MFNITEEHLKLIAQHPHLIGHVIGKTKLTKQHSQWILDCWRAEDHYALQAHRGSYKTTSCTEVGPIWWHLFHPDDRIGLIRKTATDAQKTLYTIRKAYEREELQMIFHAAHGFVPKLVTKKAETITLNFKSTITKEGSIDAFGIDGAITGSHYDKVICDDIITLKDRISKADREKTKEFMRELYTNIIDPGKFVIHVGTPWHKDDGWEMTPPNQTHDCYTTGLLTPEDIAKKKSTTTGVLFAANYELRHTATEDLIFGTFGREPEGWIHDPWIKRIYAHVDAKFNGTHYGALTIMAERLDGLIQAKGWVFEEHVEDKAEWIIRICKQYKVKSLYIETNPDKGYTAKILGTPLPGETPLNVIGYSESTNKHIKIATHLKGRWPDIVWDIDTQDAYMEQVMDYREGQEPDDAPDSAASLIRAEFAKRNTNSALYED